MSRGHRLTTEDWERSLSRETDFLERAQTCLAPALTVDTPVSWAPALRTIEAPCSATTLWRGDRKVIQTPISPGNNPATDSGSSWEDPESAAPGAPGHPSYITAPGAGRTSGS